jgi:hypothetical protein
MSPTRKVDACLARVQEAKEAGTNTKIATAKLELLRRCFAPWALEAFFFGGTRSEESSKGRKEEEARHWSKKPSQ